MSWFGFRAHLFIPREDRKRGQSDREKLLNIYKAFVKDVQDEESRNTYIDDAMIDKLNKVLGTVSSVNEKKDKNSAPTRSGKSDLGPPAA